MISKKTTAKLKEQNGKEGRGVGKDEGEHREEDRRETLDTCLHGKLEFASGTRSEVSLVILPFLPLFPSTSIFNL